jgi:hypothetical protein
MALRAPGVHTHEEWKGMAQPVGLVVEPVVLNRLGVFPESATTVLADWQQRLEQLLEDQSVGEQWLSVAPSFELFCQEVLAWQPGDLRKPEELPAPPAVQLDDYDEVLRPDWIVPEPGQVDGLLKAQLLVQELSLGTSFDALPKCADGRRSWEATPQQRLERLLKESEHPIGLLWNGVALRLVYAPRGESSGHLTFPLEPMTTVDGRPMLAALQMLLGPDRLFEGGASNTRLRPLMEQSRKEQNEVSIRLAEQVLEALWILLRGFDAAGLEVEDPSHIYGGLITVLLRLVFLLYAEDEELMPTDSLYGQHYSVGGLAQRLRQDRSDYQNAMEGRRGAWATLLSLFRLVYDGGGSTEAYLPARHGDLFDPETYPFLEGRTAETAYTDGPLNSVPAISDDVVEQVLTKLLLLDGQILSYRALDVEQIGSVYEGIMGFMVEKATGPSVGITYRPTRQKITITVVVDAAQLLAVSAAKREKWLDDQAGVPLKLPAKAKQGFRDAASLEELCLALGNRLSSHTPRGLAAGSLILQPTAERRRSGSHYTPRALTEPIVAEAFRPWLERCNGQPTAEQILALKVCDPAMGSGAFLVAVCRYLAVWLVQAWEREGYPEGFRQEWDKDTVARRLIAQRCLYGVDKNPFAVNLAKLSLWLVTLSEHLPFTFVDHALKCGDSLVGYGVQEIQSAMKEVQLGFLNEQNQVFSQMGVARRESFGDDSLNDEGYDRKKVLLQQQIKASDGLRQAGDLMVAAFFDSAKAKDRADKQQVYLAMLSGAFNDEGLQDSIQEIRDRLAAGDKGTTPFHWDLEFPEVFGDGRDGFDLVIGNPPFLGGSRISSVFGMQYFNMLTTVYSPAGHQCDMVGYFFRRCYNLLAKSGSSGLISCNTLAQGDTREGALLQILKEGGTIYSATANEPWPGMASVRISKVFICKGNTNTEVRVNGRKVSRISAFLLDGFSDDSPKPLLATPYFSKGCQIYGQGFVFDDEDQSANSLSLMNEIVKSNSITKSVIHPFGGGIEINTLPVMKPSRFVANLSHVRTEKDLDNYGDLSLLVRARVKPERDALGDNPNNTPLKNKWWAYQAHRPELMKRLEGKAFCLAHAEVSPYIAFRLVPASWIYSKTAIIIDSDRHSDFSCLQSRVHELWALSFGSTLEDRLRYTASDCLRTFPFPIASISKDALSHSPFLPGAEVAGERYHQFRAELMIANNEGLTSTYNHFHDPSETSSGLLELRRLHGEMDQAVLDAYGWNDVPTACGFGLDYLDTEDDAQLPDDLQERVDSGELFFWDAGDALDFQGQLQAYGAITGRRKLPWRYRWPDAVRDEVLARLLALNAERYVEEVNLDLHTGGRSRASANGSEALAGRGKWRGRPPKAIPAADTEQIGLGL